MEEKFSEEKLPGVYAARKKDNSIYYRSSITFRDKHISLGSFDDARSAHLAYKEAQALTVNDFVILEDYTSASLLGFDKWVCLLNFRDNGIYFSTPIYLKKKFFLYYLEPSFALKFDIDDLFYYSTKKSCARAVITLSMTTGCSSIL